MCLEKYEEAHYQEIFKHFCQSTNVTQVKRIIFLLLILLLFVLL